MVKSSLKEKTIGANLEKNDWRKERQAKMLRPIIKFIKLLFKR